MTVQTAIASQGQINWQPGAAVVADSGQGIYDFQYLVDSFLTYLEQYRQASPLTLQAYGQQFGQLRNARGEGFPINTVKTPALCQTLN